MSNVPAETDVEREMKMRCSGIDRDNDGFITISQLKVIMQTVGGGEDVSEAEVREMVQEAGCSKGEDQVDYAKFITAFHAALDDGKETEAA